MNITEYRAMVAQEKAEAEASKSVQTEQTPVVATEQATQTQGEGATLSAEQTEQNQAQTKQSQSVEIDGQEYTIDELKKGYMRQSDYTRKTQELARQRNSSADELYNTITQNPALVEQLVNEHGIDVLDPKVAQLEKVTNAYQDLLVEREVERLSSTYEDFDAREVLQFAYEHGYQDLEDAYLLYRSYNPIEQDGDDTGYDINSLKEQIRQEILNELKLNVDTGTIIQGRAESSPVRDNAPVLSSREQKVARAMKMSDAEYAKWRNKR